MKKTRAVTRALTLFIAVLLLTSAFCVVSSAADRTASYENSYGQVVPTDKKLEAQKSSYTFYGDSGTLYFMRISTGKSNANYAVEIYSDKSYKNLIRSYSDEFGQKGNSPFTLVWKFKNTASGTYYGKCYTYISREDGNIIDKDSVSKFTIKVDRLTKKTLQLNNISAASNGIKLTWSPLATATSYKVYRKGPGESKWTTLATLSSSASSYTDTTVKSGKKYTYTAKAFDGNYKSLYNTKGLSYTYLAAPSGLSVIGSGSNGYAKLSWSKVSGATGYYIYRKGGALNNSEWQKIATVKDGKTVTYTDKSATSTNWYYSYTVRAYNGSNASYYDKTGVNFNYIKAPTLQKAYSDKTGMRIEWACSDKNVTKYYIYVKSSGEWKKLGTSTQKYFIDTTAKSGKSYTYTVRPVSKNNAGAYNGNGITATYLAAPKVNSVSFDAKNNAKVTWSKVSGAKGYKIYRKIDSASSWTCIATINSGSTVSYLDSVKKSSGQTFKYTVKAINGKNASAANNSASGMYLSIPSVTAANKATAQNEAAVNLTWKTVKGAKSYTVYRRKVGESNWTKLKSGVTALSYYDKTPQSGVLYEYTVKAFNGNYSSRYTAKKITALTKPVLKTATLTADGVNLTWDKVNGADTYYVYRKSPNGKWGLIGSYSLNAYTDNSQEAKTQPFYYTVIAEADGVKGNYDTNGIASFVEITAADAVYNAGDDSNAASIKITWTAGASTQKIQLTKTASDGTPVLLGEYLTDDGVTEYTDTDITAGTEYSYTVTAIADGKLATSKTATAKYPHPPLESVDFDVQAVYNDGNYYIKVEFEPVQFAQYYTVYRKLADDAEWSELTQIKTVDESAQTVSYTDTDILPETVYLYTVKACADDRDSFYNETGKQAIIILPLDKVTDITAIKAVVDINGEQKTVAVVTWGEVENAEVYTLMRKTESGDWETLDFIWSDNPLTYTDELIEQGVHYTYTVKASATSRPDSFNEEGTPFCWEFDVPETDPSEPSTDPSEPSTDPSEPSTDPSEPSTDPSEPTTEPTEPSTEPTEPSTEPTEPSTEPSEPTTEPSEPSTEPSEPTTEPSEPTESSTEQPSEPTVEPSTDTSETA